MRVAVTGATGNLGTALLRRLAAEPSVTEVVGIARRIPDTRAAPYDGVTWHAIDVSIPGATTAIATAIAGVDAVVHLAWALQPTHDIPTQHRVNVDGTAAVLEAVNQALVGHVVVASSVGAYSPADKHDRVGEDWSTAGIPTSTYSRHKAHNERVLDAYEAAHPDIAVARIRPGLVFQRSAASEIGGLFLGRAVPVGAVRLLRPFVLPLPRPFVFQAVHADDVADAVWRILERRAHGPFNLAAGVLTPPRVAKALGMRGATPIPLRLLRAVVTATWRLRLQPTDAGWLDIAAGVPIMRTDRARDELGWVPEHSAVDAFADLVRGFEDGARVSGSPPLRG